MKLYLAGPMTGLPGYNFAEFNRVSKILRDAGHEVFNPAEIDELCGVRPDLPLDHPDQPKDWSVEIALENDIQAIFEAEGIVLLRGWRKSRGACLERTVAHFTGRKVFQFVEFWFMDGRPGGFELREFDTAFRPLVEFPPDRLASA